MNYNNNILCGDSMEELKKLPDECVDLIFADPPYNMQLDNTLIRYEGTEFDGVNKDKWDKFESLEEYSNFCIEWIKECKRVMKKNASMWIIGSFQNIFKIGSILQDLGFWIINDVIWSKPNPVPNFSGTRFTNAHETLLWVVKDKRAKPTFNYKTMKDYNGGKQMKSVWDIPLCTGNERLKNEDGKKLHSTQKPEELLKRVILSTSKEGDLVLDPFFGTGTTGAVAKKYGRNYLGIEMDINYVKAAEKRIKQIEALDLSKYRELETKPAKVTFNDLLNKGMVLENQKIYNSDKSIEATWKKDGHVDLNGQDYSIHLSAAKCLNRTNYNGWTFWYIEKDNSLILIDDLRKEYREKYLNTQN